MNSYVLRIVALKLFQLHMGWYSSPDTIPPDGYCLYQRHPDTKFQWVAEVPANQFDIYTPIETDQHYIFHVTAERNGLESPPTNEIEWCIPALH